MIRVSGTGDRLVDRQCVNLRVVNELVKVDLHHSCKKHEYFGIRTRKKVFVL